MSYMLYYNYCVSDIGAVLWMDIKVYLTASAKNFLRNATLSNSKVLIFLFTSAEVEFSSCV